jgi:hypothetical protein
MGRLFVFVVSYSTISPRLSVHPPKKPLDDFCCAIFAGPPSLKTLSASKNASAAASSAEKVVMRKKAENRQVQRCVLMGEKPIIGDTYSGISANLGCGEILVMRHE